MKAKKKWLIIIVIAIILVTVGVTFAIWTETKNQTSTNELATGCLDISLNNEGNNIKLPKAYPISDKEGMELTPYEFTVTNNCTTSVDYYINLESIEAEDGNDALASTSIKAVLNKGTARILYDYIESEPTISGAYEAYRIGYGTLEGKGSRTYELRIWIDYEVKNSEMNKSYNSKISVGAGQQISAQGSTLASLILEDAQTNNYLYSTTPNFGTVTSDSEYGLYQAADDYGTSYYFRGDVKNNYVQFAEFTRDYVMQIYNYNNGTTQTITVLAGTPMYWRIVRINGDGTVRLIYDGTELVENGTSHNAAIEDTVYNTSYDDPKYIGYTYDVDGTEVDSTIKGVVDSWYKDHLYETKYEDYIADKIFCNDREIEGSSETRINYASYVRLRTNKNPKLSCTQDSDKYTKSKNTGNGLLKYPVGLITADEVALAGGVAYIKNSANYLYSENLMYRTMSPYYFNDGVAYGWGVRGDGSLGTGEANDDDYRVRPVINLKVDSLFTGSGTIKDPYILVIEA